MTPVITGSIIAGPQLPQLLVLGVALSGYLFFNAASMWAKMPPTRRGRAVPPMLLYALVAALMCLELVLLVGVPVLGWLSLMSVPLVFAYLFVLNGSGRSLGSGLATAFASSTLVLFAIHPDMATFLRDFQTSWVWVFLIVYGQTTCTLFAVKSMIRERLSKRFLGVSIGWHIGWVLLMASISTHGLSWVWPGYFLLLTVRAAALPPYVRRHPVRPMTIGLVELALTLLMLGLMVRPGV